MPKKLLIIIPAYNEAQNILGVLNEIERTGVKQFADVLVINDASSDNTNLLVKKRNYALVTHIYNLGYGSALQLGYKYAVRRRYQFVVQMDADGQHDVCNISELYRELQMPDESGRLPDIVLGSRFVKGAAPFPVSRAKKAAFALFRTMIRMVTGKKIMDPTTGLQGLSWPAFLYYSKYNHFDEKYPDANMIMQMLLLGFQIREIPAVMHARTSGRSMHSGLKPICYMLHMFFSTLAVVFRIKVLKTGLEVSGRQEDFASFGSKN